jgi:uncharacterized protein YlxW (UPF0749 family)
VISVFGQLCQLVNAPRSTIRDAVSDIFKVVDVAAILEASRVKQEASEARATTAEDRVAELSNKVQKLQQRVLELTEEVTILQASSAM